MSGRLRDHDRAGHAVDVLAIVIDGVGDGARLRRDLLLPLAGVAQRATTDRAARRPVAPADHGVGEMPGPADRAIEDVGAAEGPVGPIAELGAGLAGGHGDWRSAVVGDRAGEPDLARVTGGAEVPRRAASRGVRAAVGSLGGRRAGGTDLRRIAIGTRQSPGVIAVRWHLAVGAGRARSARMMPVDPAEGAGRTLFAAGDRRRRARAGANGAVPLDVMPHIASGAVRQRHALERRPALAVVVVVDE